VVKQLEALRPLKSSSKCTKTSNSETKIHKIGDYWLIQRKLSVRKGETVSLQPEVLGIYDTSIPRLKASMGFSPV